MQIIETMMKQKAKELLNAGKVSQVIAWRRGEFFYDNAPAYFRTAEETEDLSYNAFCGSNLTKYLIANTKKDEKTAVFLKPCDTYRLNQLLKDRRVKREMVYVIGIPCAGMVDVAKLKAQAGKGLLRAAETEEDARLYNPGYGRLYPDDPRWGKDYNSWCHHRHVSVEYLGEARPGHPPGIVTASFNAG